MGKVEKAGQANYHKFDLFGTEELETVLQAYFAAPEDAQIDVDAVLYISKLLAERSEEKENISQDDIAAAKAKFYKHYYTLADENQSLYDFVDEQKTDRLAGIKRILPLLQIGWRRFACAVAVLVLLMFGGTVTAYAFGYDPLAAIISWSEEQSSSARPVVTAELIDIMSSYQDVELVPKWLPRGYLFDSVEKMNYGVRKHIQAVFSLKNSDNKLLINYTRYDSTSFLFLSDMEEIKHLYEKNYGNISVYSINKIDHYILGNDRNRTIAWVNGNYEGLIAGSFSIEDAVKMINSIYE